jgi:hypothetical protein
MSETISLLKEKLERANAKISRYERSLKAAEIERSDIETTLRVLGELSGESDDKASAESGAVVSQRQHNILRIMPVGKENGQSPLDLHMMYTAIFGEISIDVFRTTIWRMAKSSQLCSEHGKYWKAEQLSKENEPPMATPLSGSDAGALGVQPPSAPISNPLSRPSS